MQPKYHVQCQKTFYVLSVSAFIFCRECVSYSQPIRLSGLTLSMRRVTASPGIADYFRCWTSILGADRKERGLWERDENGQFPSGQCSREYARLHIPIAMPNVCKKTYRKTFQPNIKFIVHFPLPSSCTAFSQALTVNWSYFADVSETIAPDGPRDPIRLTGPKYWVPPLSRVWSTFQNSGW